MNFVSFTYLAFLPTVLILYYALLRGWKNPLLLLASYFFYACWNPVYALLMLLSTAVTYLAGRLMDGKKQVPKGHRAAVLALCLVINLAILITFKYFNYFNDLLDVAFHMFGRHFVHPHPNILLPVGISFYTFQALGYSVDVYRGEPAEKNFVTYALFVSFFPQLVAGPIERGGNILPQLKREHRFSTENLRTAMLPLVWGYFKKMVIADRLAILVNAAFDAPQNASALQLVIATFAFAIQVYCDFSAYSDIARGSARMFGVELMENFNRPYFADSIQDFWRRWHISLSTWFKDYIYFPLGGSRVKSFRHYLNLMAVFLISGLWHGAASQYVVWGLLHGGYQVVGLLTRPAKDRVLTALNIPEDSRLLHAGRVAVTFLLTCFAWIFFRADSLRGALFIIGRIFSGAAGAGSWKEQLLSMGLTFRQCFVAGLSCCILAAVDWKNAGHRLETAVNGRRWLLYPVLFLLIAAAFIFGVYGAGVDPQAFIYFQF